jgi:hypothetical protein
MMTDKDKESAARSEGKGEKPQYATPSHPVNLVPLQPTAKVQPNEGVDHFVVRTNGVPSFRRVGIDFGPQAVLVKGSDLSPEQQIELLNTDTLLVEQVGGRPVKAEDKAKAPK